MKCPMTHSKRLSLEACFLTARSPRIITPGTLIDEHFMDPLVNNYLLSIHVDSESLKPRISSENSSVVGKPASVLNLPRMEVGLAWLDLSSGTSLRRAQTSPLCHQLSRELDLGRLSSIVCLKIKKTPAWFLCFEKMAIL